MVTSAELGLFMVCIRINYNLKCPLNTLNHLAIVQGIILLLILQLHCGYEKTIGFLALAKQGHSQWESRLYI